MVYFLKPSYSLKYSGGFDPMAGNNLYIIAGSAVVALLVVVLYVQFQRPCFMQLCDKNKLDTKGKPTVNWMRTSLFALVVALLVAAGAVGILMAMEPKSSSPSPSSM